MKMHSKIKPLPFFIYFRAVAAIAVAGLANAVYLAISHYRVYVDIGYKSFCAVSKSINCDTVSQSPYSIFLNLPVPVWGIVGYLFFLALLYPACRTASEKNRLWPTLFITALCFSIYSVILALISTIHIRSYCIMCLATYAVNFLLLFFTWLTHRRLKNISILSGLKQDFRLVAAKKKESIIFFSVCFMTVFILMVIFPAYWKIDTPPLNQELSQGATEKGHPWIGAEHPRLTIEEFTDYQCFQCKKMHFYLRQLVAQYPDRLRLVHRHFPMDHAYNPLIKEPYHTGSGKMSLFSLYAAEKNKFWEINDMLFNLDLQKGHFNIRGMANAAGFEVFEFAASVNDKRLLHKLRKDIIEGIRLGITGTPGYLINAEVHVGHVPPEIINTLRD